MPPHATYIETHLGGGAIIKRKPAALNNIGLDLNPRALSRFNANYPVELISACAHDFLAKYAYDGHELIYCAPPYLTSTRSHKRKYRFDYTDDDHVKLLETLNTLPCAVMLSGYPSLLYDQLLSGWRTLEIQVMNHGGVRTKKIWFNFTPDRFFWSSFAGKNHTDRQSIKCKASNWAKNYKAMGNQERLAVLAAIMAVEAEGT
ncbi:MAG: DNA adenine methylase [Pseudomonadales bacterium]|nr:DNA adenine methylase [Pseudomonadales bacterium]